MVTCVTWLLNHRAHMSQQGSISLPAQGYCYAPQAYLSVSRLCFQSAYYMCTTGPLTATTRHLSDLAAISMISSYSLNTSFLLYLPIPDPFPMSTQPPSLGVTSNDSCTRESILYYSD